MSKTEALDLLRELGAMETDHPGGNLYDHLVRVMRRLEEWEADPTVCDAGLMHGLYVSDSSACPLDTMIDLSERSRVAEIIGPQAEDRVYLYGAADLEYTYPRLTKTSGQWRDRFTGDVRTLTTVQISDFMEITVANELDIAGHDRDPFENPDPQLVELVTRARPFLSDAAKRHCAPLLA